MHDIVTPNIQLIYIYIICVWGEVCLCLFYTYLLLPLSSGVHQSTAYDNPIFRRGATQRRSSRGSLWLPLEVPKADDWELPSCNILLNEEEPLGEGCFGTVHKGVVKGPILHSRTMKNTICMNVALKFLKSKSILVFY